MNSAVDLDTESNWLPPYMEVMEEPLKQNISIHNQSITIDRITIYPITGNNCTIFITLICLLVIVLIVLFTTLVLQLRNNDVELWKFARILKPVREILLAIICLFIFTITCPMLLCFLLLCTVYRFVIYSILKTKTDFVGMMEGTDAMWAIEDEKAYSIITALAIIEVPKTETPFELFHKLKSRIDNRLFSSPIPYEKIFCKRNSFGGYFYWERSDSLSVDDYVRQLPILTNKKNITKADLDHYIASISNEKLYRNHSKSWEILIGQQRLVSSSDQYPLVIRLHHTLGDGYALLQLLLEAISETKPEFYDSDMVEKYNSGSKNISSQLQCTKFFSKFLQIFTKWFSIPLLLMKNSFRIPDQNCLHTNQKLSGTKVVAWWSDKSGELLQQIKRVKSKVPNIRFCDVIIAAISVGFCRYFEKNGGNIPECVTSVIPARAEMLATNLDKTKLIELNNRFTVGVLTVPMCSNKQSIERLKRVHQYTEKLRTSMEFGVNYWIINILSVILPSQILAAMIYSRQCTAVISNIPGPSKISMGDGLVMDDLIFWIPNRGNTGIGISVFTYGNRIQIAILSDKMFIPTTEDAYTVLTDIVDELRHLDYATQSKY